MEASKVALAVSLLELEGTLVLLVKELTQTPTAQIAEPILGFLAVTEELTISIPDIEDVNPW